MNAAEYFYRLLKPLFPENANFKTIDLKTDELIFRVNWRVSIAGRPNRRSRPILLRLSYDVLDDYQNDPKGQKGRDEFIAAYVKAKLDAFVDDQVADTPIEWKIIPDNTYSAKPLLPIASIK